MLSYLSQGIVFITEIGIYRCYSILDAHIKSSCMPFQHSGSLQRHTVGYILMEVGLSFASLIIFMIYPFLLEKKIGNSEHVVYLATERI